jgi:SAM-dependent methyltransferase
VSLLDRKEHFEFGENWRDYAATLDRPRIDQAIAGLRRLFPEGLSGKTFLDIGCGSGLHSLAALELGAASVHAVDLDENSVATARSILTRFADGRNWSVEQRSVFDLAGRFDVVYSWGVLHHTGDVTEAIGKAATLVAPRGHLVIALYRPTRLDRLWVAEKRWYAKAGPRAQRLARAIHVGLLRVHLALTGQRFKAYVESYNARGMDFGHDVHDWLGGYPYESVSAADVEALMAQLGLQRVREFAVSRSARPVGVLGSGCDEYVYRRPES